MAVGQFLSNQGTQTGIAIDTIGGGTVMAIQKIDISPLGASGTIWGGGVTGTINSGSIIITAGTQQALGTIGTLGTISGLGTLPGVGVVTSLTNGSINIPNGTLQALGTVGTVGTIQNLGSLTNIGTIPNIPGGTLTLVTTVSNLTNGSVAVTAGTIVSVGTIGTLGLGTITGNLGTIGTLGLGTITGNLGTIGTIGLGTVVGNGGSMIAYGPAAAAAAAAGNPLNIGGTDSGGTIRTIKVDSGGLQRIGIDSGTISVLPNLPQGSINVTAGTIASLGTMGTLGTLSKLGSVTNLGQVYNAGTLQAGTLQINQLPTNSMTTYGTMGTQASGTTFFTIQGTVGGGTEAIVSDWSIVVMAGTCGVSLSFGTNSGTFVQGTGVIAAGSFPAGGGIAQSVESALNSGTNGQIFAGLYGNGTAYYHVSYYKATTTI